MPWIKGTIVFKYWHDPYYEVPEGDERIGQFIDAYLDPEEEGKFELTNYEVEEKST